MFHSWASRLKRYEESHDDVWSQLDQTTTTTPTQENVSRCSFYAKPHQTILSRGGYVNDANEVRGRNNWCSSCLTTHIIP
jgi:hypothetical protein